MGTYPKSARPRSFVKQLAGVVISLTAVLAFLPVAARADASCDALFAGLRGKAQENSRTYVLALWTTNYFVPERDQRFMSKTEIVMRFQNGDLFGAQRRDQIVFAKDDKPKKGADDTSVRIRRDGKLMFSEQYGPYDPRCLHGKFALVHSGDSLETFSFRIGNDLSRSLGAGDALIITPPSGEPAPSADDVPSGARQWNVANSDTVLGNVEYGLFNLRRKELNLTSQMGSIKRDGGFVGSDYSILGWAGTSGGYFVFVRTNVNDRRPLTDLDVVAIYNTRAKGYLKGNGLMNSDYPWSSRPEYEWMVRGRVGADFALYNVRAEDYLVLNEAQSPGVRAYEKLTYRECQRRGVHPASCATIGR